MLKIISNSCTNSLKLKLTCIYVLNAIDIVFTFALLKTGLFYEANSLMTSIVESVPLSILVKLLLPALLILYIIVKLDDTKLPNLKLCNALICTVLGIYLAIDALHVYYTCTYLIF